MNLLTPAAPAADGITAAKGNRDLASLDARLHLNPDDCRLGEERTIHVEARERGPRTIYETVEDWVYDLGPGRLVRTFTFRNGRVQLIETGGYGT